MQKQQRKRQAIYDSLSTIPGSIPILLLTRALVMARNVAAMRWETSMLAKSRSSSIHVGLDITQSAKCLLARPAHSYHTDLQHCGTRIASSRADCQTACSFATRTYRASIGPCVETMM